MRLLCALFALLLTATAAQARPDARTMTCEAVRALIDERGAAVITTGRHTYKRFVAHRGFCLYSERIGHDWIATADLQTHLVRPIAAGSVVVECRPIRVGARRLVIDAILTDGDGGFCGTGRMAFSRIPGSATKASAADVREPKPAGFTMDGGTPITDPLTERCGMQLVGPGQLRFDKSTYVENSFGTVNGGVLALSAEVAAVSACGGGQALDLHVHYLEQIGEGPVAVTAEVIRDSSSGQLCSVRIEDRADARLVAVADVLVAR